MDCEQYKNIYLWTVSGGKGTYHIIYHSDSENKVCTWYLYLGCSVLKLCEVFSRNGVTSSVLLSGG